MSLPVTDRELLALAAKAIGYRWDAFGIRGDGNWWTGSDYLESWNPLADDGDALRLAVKLRITVEWGCKVVSAKAPFMENFVTELGSADPYAATRLAIVRAAAEIGRAMP